MKPISCSQTTGGHKRLLCLLWHRSPTGPCSVSLLCWANSISHFPSLQQEGKSIVLIHIPIESYERAYFCAMKKVLTLFVIGLRYDCFIESNSEILLIFS